MNDELSNELGANGKINYLKNISGLWLIQEIRRNFRADGKDYSYNDMEQLARDAKPFQFFIDPDYDLFAQPGNMPDKIADYCEKQVREDLVQTASLFAVFMKALRLNINMRLTKSSLIQAGYLMFCICSAAVQRMAFCAK